MCLQTSIDIGRFWLEVSPSAVVRDSRQPFQDIGTWSPILMLGSALRGNPVRFRGGPAAVREDEGAARHCVFMYWVHGKAAPEDESRARRPTMYRSPRAPSREGTPGIAACRSPEWRQLRWAPCYASQGAFSVARRIRWGVGREGPRGCAFNRWFTRRRHSWPRPSPPALPRSEPAMIPPR